MPADRDATPPTAAELDEWEKTHAAATPGEWVDDGWDNFEPDDFSPVRAVGPRLADGSVDVDRTVCHVLVWDCDPKNWEEANRSRCKANAAAIVAARNAFPRLIAAAREAERLRGEVAELRRTLKAVQDGDETTYDQREAFSDALANTHLSLGGSGEWVHRNPAPPPPNSGDLVFDVPTLAAEVRADRDALHAENARLRADLAAKETPQAVWTCHRCLRFIVDYDYRPKALCPTCDRPMTLQARMSEARDGGEKGGAGT